MDKYTYKVIYSQDDNEYVGLCVEFPSLSYLQASQTKAFNGIKKLVNEVVADMKKSGEIIPKPLSTKQYSGKILVRIPPDIHKKLAMSASENNISLNRLISAKLSQ